MKIKKPTLCCCFTWIVFIELTFTVAFLLIRKLGMIDLPVRWGGGWLIFRNEREGDPSNERVILKWRD